MAGEKCECVCIIKDEKILTVLELVLNEVVRG